MHITELLLASNSPRRRELLGGLDIPYEVVRLKDVAETYPPHLCAGDIPLHIASLKMDAYDMPLASGEVLITADTVVWLDGRVMGKPHDEAEAEAMLTALAGRTHQVYTAVCLRWQQGSRRFVCGTDVTFAPLKPEQIHYYVQHYRPLDKAGAYGIQEWIGYVGVQRIEGSYFNVMGLPVQRLYTELQRIENEQQRIENE
jgi:septum formation protein